MEGDATALKAAWSNGSPSRNGGSDLFQPQEPSSSTAGLLSSLPLGHTSGPQGQDSLASAQTLGPRTALDTYGQPTPSNSEANSVARLQQNLQRLYGSYNQLNYGSRTSLPDIQEEDADGSAAASMLRGAGSTARVASEEDLFKLDPIPGTSGAMPAADVPGMGTHHQESRTLLIRGIDPTMADETLKEYFECFGDIHSLYTASKHRGYVMVVYHDIRAARLAQHTIHGQTWSGRQLTCAYAHTGDANTNAAMATLLLVSLDGGRSLEDAFYVLSSFGELRELRKDGSRPNCVLAEFYDDRQAANALKSIASSPELSNRLLALDARIAAGQANGGGGPASLPASLAHSSMQGSSTQLDASLLLNAGGGMHQSASGGLDFSNMTRSLSEMSLESAPAASGLAGFGSAGGLAGMSSGDLVAQAGPMPNRAGMQYPIRGIASTGSMWPGQSAPSLGSSPVTGAAWPAQMQDLMVQQQQQQQQLVALQQQQHQQQQTVFLQQQQQQQQAAVHAALQQALLSQRVAAAAAIGMHAPAPDVIGGGLPRRNFSEPTLGGRLARRPMDPMAEAERRVQQERLYGLDLQRIANGEDKRTTLMIKNIPNKYTQKMLLTLLEERFASTRPFPFDFFYLPIDFKNRCNVGYAFINMTAPSCIPALVEEFHGRRWPKFNSEKVCRIAYARIQGKMALVQHFQNSSLLHEDKRCRPVLFTLNGDVETFPIVTVPPTATPPASALAPSVMGGGTPGSDPGPVPSGTDL